jgi:hypothetical protein
MTKESQTFLYLPSSNMVLFKKLSEYQNPQKNWKTLFKNSSEKMEEKPQMEATK